MYIKDGTKSFAISCINNITFGTEISLIDVELDVTEKISSNGSIQL